jgi:hypothetical protein
MPKKTLLPTTFQVLTYDLKSEHHFFLSDKVKSLEALAKGLYKFENATKETDKQNAVISIQNACNQLQYDYTALDYTDLDKVYNWCTNELETYRGASNIIRSFRNIVPIILRDYGASFIAQSVCFITIKKYDRAMEKLKKEYDEMRMRVNTHLAKNGASNLWTAHIQHWDFDKQFHTLVFEAQNKEDTEFIAKTYKIQQINELDELIETIEEVQVKVEKAKTSIQLAGIRKSANALYERYCNLVDVDWIADTELENKTEKEDVVFLMSSLLESINDHPSNQRVIHIEL